jgi:hypothetical protein
MSMLELDPGLKSYTKRGLQLTLPRRSVLVLTLRYWNGFVTLTCCYARKTNYPMP